MIFNRLIKRLADSNVGNLENPILNIQFFLFFQIINPGRFVSPAFNCKSNSIGFPSDKGIFDKTKYELPAKKYPVSGVFLNHRISAKAGR
jgi:hypothetical protein